MIRWSMPFAAQLLQNEWRLCRARHKRHYAACRIYADFTASLM